MESAGTPAMLAGMVKRMSSPVCVRSTSPCCSASGLRASQNRRVSRHPPTPILNHVQHQSSMLQRRQYWCAFSAVALGPKTGLAEIQLSPLGNLGCMHLTGVNIDMQEGVFQARALDERRRGTGGGRGDVVDALLEEDAAHVDHQPRADLLRLHRRAAAQHGASEACPFAVSDDVLLSPLSPLKDLLRPLSPPAGGGRGDVVDALLEEDAAHVDHQPRADLLRLHRRMAAQHGASEAGCLVILEGILLRTLAAALYQQFCFGLLTHEQEATPAHAATARWAVHQVLASKHGVQNHNC